MEDDPRIEKAVAAIEAVEQAKDYLLEAQITSKGIIGTTLWKRIDKELGVLQALCHDLREWRIKNGIE